MSETPSAPLHTVRLVWAAAFVSGLVLTDLLLKLFCGSWPLIMYLIIGGIGTVVGPPLHRRFSGENLGSTTVRRSANILGVLAAVGIVMLCVMPVSWDLKCSWRYCGRAMGPGLFQSPFSVGTPTCGGWHKCVNEYPYSRSEYATAMQRIRQQGCSAP